MVNYLSNNVTPFDLMWFGKFSRLISQ